MSAKFSSADISKLFDYAIQSRQAEAAGLALKVAQARGVGAAAYLEKAVDNSGLYQFAIVNGLAQFARYDQVALISKLLEADSEKVRLIAVACLEVLKDPVTLDALKKIAVRDKSEIVEKKAHAACRKIAEHPVPIRKNTFYTLKTLVPLQPEDICYAEFILDRDLSIGDEKVLVKLLASPEAGLRARAVKALSTGAKKRSDTIINAMIEVKAPVTKELIEVLAALKNPSGSALIIAWLKDKESYDDLGAIEALGKIGGEEAGIFLVQRIVQDTDHSSYKEKEALKSMRNLPVAYLLSEYENNSSFRRQGSKTLVEIIGDGALKALLDALQDRYRTVRQNAGLGLVKLRKAAVSPLIELLGSSNDEDLKLHICAILGDIGDSRALPVLNKLTEDSMLRSTAIRAVGQIADPLATDILSRYVTASDNIMQELAMAGLGGQRDKKAAGLLIKQLDNKDNKIRLAAIAALTDMVYNLHNDQPLVIRAILSLMTDTVGEVARMAKASLLNLAGFSDIVISEAKKKAKTSLPGSPFEKLHKEIIKSNIREELDYHPVAKKMARREGRKRSTEHPKPKPKHEIPEPINDLVQFAVSGPESVAAGSTFILDAWAYQQSFTGIEELAQKAQRGQPVALRTKGPVKVQRDTVLTVEIKVPQLKASEQDTIYWSGTTGNCTFRIKVPAHIEQGFYIGTAKFYVGAFIIAKLDFDIKVGALQATPVDITTKEKRVKTAFASYASEDRAKVLGRIQGMLKLLPDLNVFLDVASLRSGEHWEDRLNEEIKLRDTFYLFWSRSASKSKWVEMEWRTALSLKGIECIDPVPLEPPQKVPPPKELSALHFNEWTLAFERQK